LDNRGRDLGRGSSGGEDHLLLVGIPLAPVGGLRGLWRRLDWFCAEGGWHRSLELSRGSRGSAASISMGRATRWPRPAWLCVRDHLSPTDLNGYAQQQRSGRRFGPDLGNHQGSSTNSFSSLAVMPLWRCPSWPRRLAKLDRAVPLSNGRPFDVQVTRESAFRTGLGTDHWCSPGGGTRRRLARIRGRRWIRLDERYRVWSARRRCPRLHLLVWLRPRLCWTGRRTSTRLALVASSALLTSNRPLHLSIPPQGHRSIIEKPGTCGGLAAERPAVDMERPRKFYY
jgi:hypothetical protein